jgi:hypothetical protein
VSVAGLGSYAVSSDGQRFVVIDRFSANDGGLPPLTVVLNWTDTLAKEASPVGKARCARSDRLKMLPEAFAADEAVWGRPQKPSGSTGGARESGADGLFE